MFKGLVYLPDPVFQITVRGDNIVNEMRERHVLASAEGFPTVCGKRGIISWDSVGLSGSPSHSADEILCLGVLAMEKNGCLVS
jgi:hypothetical protein